MTRPVLTALLAFPVLPWGATTVSPGITISPQTAALNLQIGGSSP